MEVAAGFIITCWTVQQMAATDLFFWHDVCVWQHFMVRDRVDPFKASWYAASCDWVLLINCCTWPTLMTSQTLENDPEKWIHYKSQEGISDANDSRSFSKKFSVASVLTIRWTWDLHPANEWAAEATWAEGLILSGVYFTQERKKKTTWEGFSDLSCLSLIQHI